MVGGSTSTPIRVRFGIRFTISENRLNHVFLILCISSIISCRVNSPFLSSTETIAAISKLLEIANSSSVTDSLVSSFLAHLPQLWGCEDGISISCSRNQAIFCTTFSITFGLLGMRILILWSRTLSCFSGVATILSRMVFSRVGRSTSRDLSSLSSSNRFLGAVPITGIITEGLPNLSKINCFTWGQIMVSLFHVRTNYGYFPPNLNL